MKSLYVAIAIGCLSPLIAQAQALLQLEFTSSNGVSNENTGVEFSGVLSVYANYVHVKMTNSASGTEGILTGFAVHKPIPVSDDWLGDDSSVSISKGLNGEMISAPLWQFFDGDNAKGKFGNMFNSGNLGDISHYLIAGLDPGLKQQWGVKQGETAEFVFDLNRELNPAEDFYPWLFNSTYVEPWTVMGRFQTVGDKGEESDKFYLRSVIYCVPEPSQIAFLGVGLLLVPIALRSLRSRKKK